MQTAIKERPILFSGPMVRAILDGRKTQTRRIVKCRGICSVEDTGVPQRPLWPGAEDESGNWQWLDCPHGDQGDRLWVRETTRCTCDDKSFGVVQYRADESIRTMICDQNGEGDPIGTRPHKDPFQRIDKNGPPWKPSIFMPRWASRITLEITGVKVERLNEITDKDAIAEGIEAVGEPEAFGSYVVQVGRLEGRYSTARSLFSGLWESINGPGSWAANPWVWVVEFRRVEP